MLSGTYGYPKVMSSYYFQDQDQGPPQAPANAKTCADMQTWVCEHRWIGIAGMVGWRNEASKAEKRNVSMEREQFEKAPQPPLYNWAIGMTGNAIAFSRGASAMHSAAFIVLNRDSQAWENQRFQTGLPAGRYCNVIEDPDIRPCSAVSVAADGTAMVTAPSMNAVAIH